MNEIKINDDNSGDTYELYGNLLSTQIFKPTGDSYNKNGFLNEKKMKFQSNENVFLFSDGKTELEKNNLSDNETSFGEAVDFVEQLENDSLKINVKINFEQVWSNIKSFFGFKNANQNDEQKRLQIMFGYLADKLKKNNMSKKFDELRIKAKKLDDALNQKIEIADRQNVIRISLEIKKCYFEFESSVKETLNVAKKIICQEEYLSDERLDIIKKSMDLEQKVILQ